MVIRNCWVIVVQLFRKILFSRAPLLHSYNCNQRTSRLMQPQIKRNCCTNLIIFFQSGSWKDWLQSARLLQWTMWWTVLS